MVVLYRNRARVNKRFAALASIPYFGCSHCTTLVVSILSRLGEGSLFRAALAEEGRRQKRPGKATQSHLKAIY
jgi:hypothetical protein